MSFAAKVSAAFKLFPLHIYFFSTQEEMTYTDNITDPNSPKRPKFWAHIFLAHRSSQLFCPIPLSIFTSSPLPSVLSHEGYLPPGIGTHLQEQLRRLVAFILAGNLCLTLEIHHTVLSSLSLLGQSDIRLKNDMKVLSCHSQRTAKNVT